MSDLIRDAAIEAAAKARYERDFWESWDEASHAAKDAERVGVAPLVDAVLAVALPEWRKHAFELRKTAIREARAEALRDAAEAMPDFDGTVQLGACQSCVGNTVSDVENWLNDRAVAEETTDE